MTRRNPHLPSAAELETQLVAVFTELLSVPPGAVDRNSDFFEAGGDSALAVRAVARARRLLGVPLSLRNFFDAPTPALLVQWYAPAHGGSGD